MPSVPLRNDVHWIVENRRAFGRLQATTYELLSPYVVRDNDVICEGRAESLYQQQRPERQRAGRHFELAGVKFRDDIMNIEHNFRPGQPGQPGCKNQKVGYGMDMD